MTVKEQDAAYIAHTYARFPVELVSGHGSLVQNDTGKEYIDLGSGIAVNIFGLQDAQWTAAVTAQLHKLAHTSNLYYTEPCVRLAKLLCERAGMQKVFFSNSGAEANECAIKAARQYGMQRHGTGTVLTLEGSFHGRTLATLAATGQAHYHEDFLPLTPGFVYAPANDLPAVEKLVSEQPIAAVMFEAVQGEGGVVALDKDYLQGLATLCEKQDILLIADEVQCGNGRSGELFAYMHASIHPDIVTTAKGLGGGLPLGATLFGEKAADIYQPGMHGSTFGGNPVCCAGAVNILSRLDKKLLSGVKERSAYIIKSLSGASGITAVTGMGLMLGIKTIKPAQKVAAACLENGVLVLTAKDKLRLLPALNIPMELLAQAVSAVKSACAL